MGAYGRLAQPDLFIAVPAWLSNLFVVVGCLLSHALFPNKSVGNLGTLAVAFAITTGFFALHTGIFQQRYLGLFSEY